MKASIIIPTYNRSALIQETIESVFEQTYSDYEIIVVDDGSTDDTEEALKKYSDKIRYIKQENNGINNARNRGIEHANGKYIALLDNDDLWHPWTLALYVKVLDENPDTAVAFSNFFVLKPDGQKIPNGLLNWFKERPVWSDIYCNSETIIADENHSFLPAEKKECTVYFGDIYHTSLFGPRVLPSASLYRKSMAETANIRLNESDSSCGDWEFFARLSHAHQAAFIDIEAGINRSHEDAVRLTRLDHRIQLTKRLEMIDRLWKTDPEFYDHHEKEITEEEYQISYELIKQQLFKADNKNARTTLARMQNTAGYTEKNKLRLIYILTITPGSHYLLIFLRYLLSLVK